ncbi:hypothetical protein [Nocardia aurantia]|uniref:Uncharacterized protein n=1 Tax=Nocardia aurantia TaxID=2585199 RepID=A0A7K0DL70_9NOCA|nr:hypothetical protein [Nocardia aurantia]MQY26012.1 hypothetical protein [Nocardia aurantia]
MPRDFAVAFNHVLRNLDELSGELAQAVSLRIRETSGEIRDVATAAVHRDIHGGERISGIDVDTGRRVSVGGRSVLSVPLKDDRGRLIGVQYPREPMEITRMARWVSVRNRTVDHEYYVLRPKPDPTGFSPMRTYDDPRPAPWTDPVLVQGHGDGQYFNVLVGSGGAANRGWRVLRLDAGEYARVVGSDNVFLRAAEAARSGDALLLHCATASGPAARTVAEHLHTEVGIGLRVHGFTGKTWDSMYADESGGSSWFGVDEVRDGAGNVVAPVESYPPHG